MAKILALLLIALCAVVALLGFDSAVHRIGFWQTIAILSVIALGSAVTILWEEREAVKRIISRQFGT